METKFTRRDLMQFAADHVSDILDAVRPDLNLGIAYTRITEENIGSFKSLDVERHHFLAGDERFNIWNYDDTSDVPTILYSVNVTADSVLTAAEELMHLISAKF